MGAAIVALAAVLHSSCSSSGSGGSTPPPVLPSVTLSWTASPTAGVSYEVYRGTVSGGPYASLNSATTTSYVDYSVVSGQTYYYVVTAVDSTGDESAYSNETSATLP